MLKLLIIQIEKKLQSFFINILINEHKTVIVFLLTLAMFTLLLKTKINNSFNNWKYFSGYVYNISAPVVQSLSNNYDDYVQYMKQVDMSSFKNLADKYTSSIYSIQDSMNTRINAIVNNNDIKYVKAISEKVYQQVKT